MLDINDDFNKKIHISRKKKIAFVCSGGAAKAAAFHVGVAMALRENGFTFRGGLLTQETEKENYPPLNISTYVGTSAGSVIASYLASGFSLEEISGTLLTRKNKAEIKTNGSETKRIIDKLTYQKMFGLSLSQESYFWKQIPLLNRGISKVLRGNLRGLLNLKKELKATGLFSTSGIEEYLREGVLPSNNFEEYCADLFIVASKLNMPIKAVFGKEKFKECDFGAGNEFDYGVPISESCAASTALPVLFSPYGIKNGKGEIVYYIDGEVRNTLSSHVAVDSGADLIIASYSYKPYSFTPEVGCLTQYGLTSIAIQALFLLIEQKIRNNVHNKEKNRNAINAVSVFCKTEGISDPNRMKICEILEKELSFRSNVDFIYIHPQPGDTKMFFGNYFSLSPKRMRDSFKSGFRATMDTLNKYEFER